MQCSHHPGPGAGQGQGQGTRGSGGSQPPARAGGLPRGCLLAPDRKGLGSWSHPPSQASARQDEPRDKSGCLPQNPVSQETGSERDDSTTKRHAWLIRRHSFIHGGFLSAGPGPGRASEGSGGRLRHWPCPCPGRGPSSGRAGRPGSTCRWTRRGDHSSELRAAPARRPEAPGGQGLSGRVSLGQGQRRPGPAGPSIPQEGWPALSERDTGKHPA